MPDIFVSKDKSKLDQTHHALTKKDIFQKDSDPTISFPEFTNNYVHMFSSFCKNPGDITFKNQEKGEKVILFVRKHFLTNFPWVFLGILLIILPFIVAPFGYIFNSWGFIFPSKFIFFFALFYYLFIASYMFVGFITWYFNMSLVTDRRVLDLDFSDVVYKNLASTNLSLVQDVSYTQTGVLRTFFHYGDVVVQTAGEKTHFDFEAVPQPENVVHIIGGLIGKHGTV